MSTNSSRKDLPWVRRLRPILAGLAGISGMGIIANPVLALCDQVDKDRTEAATALRLDPSDEQAKRMIEELTEKGY